MSVRLRTGMLIVAAAGSAFLASCSSKITTEQLAEMRRLRAEERSLKQQISDKNSELARLESEVSAKQKEVDNCATRKQFVQSKMAQWPNIWPAGLFPNE